MSRIEQIAKSLHVPDFSLVEAASEAGASAVELYKNPKPFGRNIDVQAQLPLAAREYAISSDLRDFVVVPVIILPTDIPNRNSVAFPLEELMRFNPSQGRPNYKTWSGKPTYMEHAHNDISQAKGIIFDTYMVPMESTMGNIHKLVALCGFDRTKDRELANAILKGERQSYSMGAFVQTYECSICGDHSKPKTLNTECGHVIRGRPELYDDGKGHMVPSYLLARNEILGFEVSSVGVPAWYSATNSKHFDMAKL